MNKTLATLTAGALATSLLAGCAADGNGGYTMTESGRATSIGAGLGALAGAVVGNAHSGSDTLRGAAIGAALGAAGGCARGRGAGAGCGLVGPARGASAPRGGYATARR